MSDRICAVDGCVKPRSGPYCHMHARRLKMWGNLHMNPTPVWPEVEPLAPDEEWRAVPGHTADYRVSNYGRILGRRRERTPGGIRQQYVNARGYWAVGLSSGGVKGTYETHRLVAAAFIGPRHEGMHVRHLDGDPLNCHLSNLAYGTVSENAQDTIEHGRNANLLKTHCPAGHPYEGHNLIVKKTRTGINRKCRTCHYEEQRRRRERKRAVGPTVNDLATFLLQHIEWISAQPFADEPAEHFHELTTQAKALAYPREVRRFICAACVEVTACDVDSRTETRCGGDLVATIKVEEDEDGLLPAEVACRVCGQSWSSGQWMTLGRHIREAS